MRQVTVEKATQLIDVIWNCRRISTESKGRGFRGREMRFHRSNFLRSDKKRFGARGAGSSLETRMSYNAFSASCSG